MKLPDKLNKRILTKEYGCKELPPIQQKQETTKHVNTILEEEKAEYVVQSDGLKVFLEKDDVAFEIKGCEITLEDGTKKIIPIPNNTELSMTSEYIIDIEGNRHFYTQIKMIDIVAVTKKQNTQNYKNKKDKYFKKSGYLKRTYVKYDEVEQYYYRSTLSEISLMELTSLKELSPEDQINFLKKYFSEFDVHSPEFIEQTNFLLRNAKNIFKKRTGPLKYHPEFKKIEDLELHSQEDVKKFLQEASNLEGNRVKTTVYCTLLKFMYLYHEMKKSPVFNLVEKIDNGVINTEDVIRDIFKLEESQTIERNNKNIYEFEKNIAGVNVNISFRVKSLQSIMNKALAKGEYLKIENFFDIFGATIYIEPKDKKYLVKIMQEIDRSFYNGGAYIKNKSMLKKEDTTELDAEDDFDKKYIKASKNKEKNTGSGEKYSDCKLIGKGTLEKKEREYLEEDISIGMEVKFLIGRQNNDTNEYGMSWHPIYDHFAKFFEGEKNRNPFIPVKTVHKHVRNLYDILMDDDLLQKYGKKKHEIFSELYTDFFGKKLQNNTDYESVFKEIYPKVVAYIVNEYKMSISSYKNQLVFVTKDNKLQLQHGGRGYEIKP